MNYYEVLFKGIPTGDYKKDLLIYQLGEIGFDTFEDLDQGFKAYAPAGNYDQAKLDEQLLPYRDVFDIDYEVTLIPQKNWNEVWESNFEPIAISDKIFVRATFHQPRPEFPIEIVIDPKMAFGTGHHQTTAMMLQYMLETDFHSKRVLDMGCGTGILAIMAAKAGANKITAIDNDAVCYESTIENAQLNCVDNITALCGSKEIIPNEKFDVILANINRNILLDQLPVYADALKTGGELYLSGFYQTPDLEIICAEAKLCALTYIDQKTDQMWTAAKFIK